MPSNYPPNVSGNEPQIVGYPDEGDPYLSGACSAGACIDCYDTDCTCPHHTGDTKDTPVPGPSAFIGPDGGVFQYQRVENGNLQVQILDVVDRVLASFELTPQQVILLYSELDWCPDCGELLSIGGHGPGVCCDPADPGGFGD